VDELFEHADDLAERAVELGGTALGTARILARASRLPEYQFDIDSGRQHVIALSGVLAKFCSSARAGIEAANGLGDADTADLFTEIRAARTSSSGRSRPTRRPRTEKSHNKGGHDDSERRRSLEIERSSSTARDQVKPVAPG
jgi:hypothetical protein